MDRRTQFENELAEARVYHAMTLSGEWLFGQKLATISNSGLWKDGGSRYRSFGQFVKTEFGITGAYGYMIIRVCALFSEPDVCRFGIGRLREVAKEPDSKRRGLLLARLRSGELRTRNDLDRARRGTPLLGPPGSADVEEEIGRILRKFSLRQRRVIWKRLGASLRGAGKV